MIIFRSLFCKEHLQGKKKGKTLRSQFYKVVFINERQPGRAENTGSWLKPDSNAVTTTKKLMRSWATELISQSLCLLILRLGRMSPMLLEINRKNIITSNYNLNATDTVVPFKHSFPNNYTTGPKISGYIFMLRTRLLCDYLTQFYVFPGSWQEDAHSTFLINTRHWLDQQNLQLFCTQKYKM